MSEPRNTRERIKLVAMELFSEQGYDRTSLREISERLGLTKAAIYYHFKTKEDIAASYFDDFAADVDALRDWAAQQPQTRHMRHELLRRYSDLLRVHGPTMRFMHNNQPALRNINKGRVFKGRMRALNSLLVPENTPTINRLRAANAIFAMHMAWFVDLEEFPTPEKLADDALRIATELIDANEAAYKDVDG